MIIKSNKQSKLTSGIENVRLWKTIWHYTRYIVNAHATKIEQYKKKIMIRFLKPHFKLDVHIINSYFMIGQEDRHIKLS